MKPTVVSCLVLICLILVLAIKVQAGPRRITFDPETIDSTGNPVEFKMISIGVESSGSSLTQKPRRCQLIKGIVYERTPADSVLYIFAVSSIEDSTLVEDFLSSCPPEEWAGMKRMNREGGSRFARLFEPGASIEVPISPDGNFFCRVDNKRHPRMSRMVIVDSGGKILARRLGLVERR